MLQIKIGSESIVVPLEDFVPLLAILAKAKVPNYTWKSLSFEVSEVPDYFLQNTKPKLPTSEVVPSLHNTDDAVPF